MIHLALRLFSVCILFVVTNGSSLASPLRGESGEIVLGLGRLNAVAYAPDGKLIATCGDAGVFLWNAETGEFVRALFGHTGPVKSASFSPDGALLLTGSRDNTAKLWDTATGHVIRAFSGGGSAAFSPDGTKVLTGSDIVRMWETATGKAIRTFAESGPAAFSPDGKRALIGRALLDADTGITIRTFSGNSANGNANLIETVAFSPDGSIASVGSIVQTELWDTATGNLIDTYPETDPVVFSPDGTLLVWGDKLCNAATRYLIRTFPETRGVNSIAFSPDGTKVLIGNGFVNATLWDTATGTSIRTFSGHTCEVGSVAFSPDGSKVLTGSADWWNGESSERTAKLWDTATGNLVFTLSEDLAIEPIVSTEFSPDGTLLLTGSAYPNYCAKLWDAVTGNAIRTFTGHSLLVASVAFSPNGKQILTGSHDGTAKVWEANTGYLQHTLETGRVSSVTFSPDGTQALTGGERVQLWDIATGNLIRAFGESDSVAFSPDGTKVVTGNFDTSATLWDAATGTAIRTFPKHLEVISSVAFSPDGTQVLTGSWDTTAKLWDAATGNVIHTFIGHSGCLSSVAFSPDGKRILTGSWDGTTRIWDIGDAAASVSDWEIF